VLRPPHEFRYWFGVELGFAVAEAGLAVVAGFGFADGVAVGTGEMIVALLMTSSLGKPLSR
jgi:hypothetical protein